MNYVAECVPEIQPVVPEPVPESVPETCPKAVTCRIWGHYYAWTRPLNPGLKIRGCQIRPPAIPYITKDALRVTVVLQSDCKIDTLPCCCQVALEATEKLTEHARWTQARTPALHFVGKPGATQARQHVTIASCLRYY